MNITIDNYGIDRIELKHFVETNFGLVSKKSSLTYPGLHVLKFTKRVFFDNLFDQHPLLMQCRGLVVDNDYNVVQLPFKKIFNYQENGAGLDWKQDSLVYLTRKINGFMASVSVYNGKCIISTTGSLDSDFVHYAKKYLGSIDPSKLDSSCTYLFEICHPDDPHIIEEVPGAYLLCIKYKGKEFYSFDNTQGDFDLEIRQFADLGINIDEWVNPLQPMVLSDAIHLARTADHEGFVFMHAQTRDAFKIKSKMYLIKKMVARKTDIMKLDKNRVDEEFHYLIDSLKANTEFKSMSEQERLKFMTNYFDQL